MRGGNVSKYLYQVRSKYNYVRISGAGICERFSCQICSIMLSQQLLAREWICRENDFKVVYFMSLIESYLSSALCFSKLPCPV